MYSDRQKQEIFHFLFLERLLKISDPKLYVIKGGVNLRFFFHSPRYSEDLDIDVLGGAVEGAVIGATQTLAETVASTEPKGFFGDVFREAEVIKYKQFLKTWWWVIVLAIIGIIWLARKLR